MKKSKKTLTWTILIVVSVVFVILVTGSFLFSHLAKKKIREAQPGNFKVQADSIETNFFKRQIIVYQATLESANSKTHITFPKIKITGLRFIPLIFNNKIVINNLDVQGPSVFLYKSKQVDTTGTSSKKKQLVTIKHLEIPEFQFYYFSSGPEEPDTLISTLSNLQVWNLSTDTIDAQYSAGGIQFDRLKFKADKGAINNIKNGLYLLTFNDIHFDSDDPDLVIGNTTFTSTLPKDEIGPHQGAQTDWFDATIDSIIFRNIKAQRILKDTALIFDQLTIKNLDIDIFRDKTLPFPDKPNTKLPVELVNNLALGLHCDSAIIEQASVKYQELVKKADEPMEITFNNLNGTIYNFGNIDSLKNGQMKLLAQTAVMDKAILDVDIIFRDIARDTPSQVTGTLEPVQFEIFNPVLVPSSGVKIQSGEIIQLAFNFGYTDSQSKGDMIFKYDNLNFKLLDRETNSKELILSFLAETFVIKNQNIEGNKSYKKGEISFERDKKKSIFNYWWKSLLSGLKDVAVKV